MLDELLTHISVVNVDIAASSVESSEPCYLQVKTSGHFLVLIIAGKVLSQVHNISL